jgi:glutamyl-tRNA reductase
VQDSELVAVARSVKPHLDLDELVLLSSCNRVEIYRTTRRAITDGKSLSRLLCSETEDLTPHVCLYKGVAAARHLLRVTASLDSMVLGETARAGGLTGRVLNHFFQKAFQAAKEIRTRTEIGRGAVSIKSAAVELVGRIFEDDLAGRAIMVIGAGRSRGRESDWKSESSGRLF